MDPKATDKQRLRQVQTQDLTESRVNDDFVFWLKKNGMNYLLVGLIAACGVLGWNWWKRKQVERTAVAWTELSQATQPESLEALAKEHAEIPQAAMFAYVSAADLRMRQIALNELTPRQGDTPAVPLDDAGRKIAQDAAYEDYEKAAEIATRIAGGDASTAALVVVPSLFGRAAICESRGDLEGARKYLSEAEKIAGDRWPRLAEIAKLRIDGLVALATPLAMPAQAELPVKAMPEVAPVAGDTLFQDLIREQQNATGAPTTGGDAPQLIPIPSPAPAPAPSPAPAPAPGG